MINRIGVGSVVEQHSRQGQRVSGQSGARMADCVMQQRCASQGGIHIKRVEKALCVHEAAVPGEQCVQCFEISDVEHA